MDQKDIIVIKFGGAYITKKSEHQTIHQDNLNNLVFIVGSLSKIGYRVILIHGAGSFGHHEAKKYSVNLGLPSLSSPPPSSNVNLSQVDYLTEGMLKTRESVTLLLDIVKSKLIESGLNVFTISPFSSWRTNSGGKVVVTHNIDNIKFLLNSFPTSIPILHGDVCLDDDTKCAIISGDVIIKQICSSFSSSLVKKCIFVTDVYGVYNSDPSSPNSKLINYINASNNNGSGSSCNNNESIDTNTSNMDDQRKDVTGGMEAKLKSAFEIAKLNIWTLIIGGGYSKEEILQSILNDRFGNHSKDSKS